MLNRLVNVRHLAYNSRRLSLAQQRLVPRAQLLHAHRLVPVLWVERAGVEDVLVSRLRRSHPNVSVLEAQCACMLEVAVDDAVIHGGARPRRGSHHVRHRVEVRDVRPIGVWLRAVRAVLLDVHGEAQDVMPLDGLECQQQLRLIRKAVGVVVVTCLHLAHHLVEVALVGHEAHHEIRGHDLLPLQILVHELFDGLRQRADGQVPCLALLQLEHLVIANRQAESVFAAVLANELLRLQRLITRQKLRWVWVEGADVVVPSTAVAFALHVVVVVLLLLGLPHHLIEAMLLQIVAQLREGGQPDAGRQIRKAALA
mmetsp:Transcript_43731/g.108824  ORF Transcript_43731/g.108824 Transcript_43731/m.108824 type:complete len:313 (+) Transcript_43731:777-1715(+)